MPAGMKLSSCPQCEEKGESGSILRRNGKYFRASTSSWVQKYSCPRCFAYYSDAIFEDGYRQKKRQLNGIVASLLCGLMSQNEVARVLKVNRKTVVRKFRHEAFTAIYELRSENLNPPPARRIEFDDLETHENTLLKPLSVTLAVEYKSRRILGIEVSQMPERGRLTRKSREKYGPRRDLRRAGRSALLESLQELVDGDAEIRTDANPHYPPLLKKYFPAARHTPFPGKRGTATAQGELKRVRYDPLFYVNQTCAMLRANVNRLIRRTWCTTKRVDQLQAHLVLYAAHFNRRLRAGQERRARRLLAQPPS